MKEQLITALVEKQAFVDDTIFTASYKSQDLFGRIFSKVGDFRLQKIIKQQSSTILELSILEHSKIIVMVDPTEIQLIDGMDLHRFAEIYDLHIDGSQKKTGRKRGRKSKVR